MSVNERIIINSSNISKYFRQTSEFIFVDEIEVYPGVEAFGCGRARNEDWYFNFHFPNDPIMPGVFQMEAIQQTAGVIINTLSGKIDNKVLFLSAEKLKIMHAIIPGMAYHTFAKVLNARRGIWKFEGKLEVDGILFCKMIFSLIDFNEIQHFSKGKTNEIT